MTAADDADRIQLEVSGGELVVVPTGDARHEAGVPTRRAAACLPHVFRERLHYRGHWVFAGGLDARSTSTVVDHRGADAGADQRPFVVTKEHMAGLCISRAADLSVAYERATAGSKACNRRVEVRPLLAPPQ